MGQPALEAAYLAAVAEVRVAASALLRAPAGRLGDVLLKARLAADRLELDLIDPEDVAIALGRDDHALSALIELHRDLARLGGTPSPTAHVAPWRPGEWLGRLADQGHALDLAEGPVRFAPGAPAKGFPPAPGVFADWRALGPVRQSRLVEHAKRGGPRAATVTAMIDAAREASRAQQDDRLRASAAARGGVPKEVELARAALSAEPLPADAGA